MLSCLAPSPAQDGFAVANLFFSATAEKLFAVCNQSRLIARGAVAGKLPATTGWQPVLPRNGRHVAARHLAQIGVD